MATSSATIPADFSSGSKAQAKPALQVPNFFMADIAMKMAAGKGY